MAAAMQGAAHPIGSNLGFSVLLKDTMTDFEPPTLQSLENPLYLVSHSFPIQYVIMQRSCTTAEGQLLVKPANVC